MSAPFVWFDLTAVHAEFYENLFGWTTRPGAGDYQSWFTAGGQPWGGVAPADDVPAGRWVPYVMVDDLDVATKRAVELGGRIVRQRTTGPGGTSVIVADPGDALVALFVPTN
ncbi:VOC family protein [Paractinoplanes rishiriensis]|uniref:Glyoxalase n=1 Tax=Paractinoplanes rishiriensis TaxID=1050105 RepID=A0A919K9L5_9ACTN|nr:VOC family protein [Actinoplanes rishiriensis]GIF01195.1 glyoxalase [Actinoplanes rishiriensis]